MKYLITIVLLFAFAAPAQAEQCFYHNGQRAFISETIPEQGSTPAPTVPKPSEPTGGEGTGEETGGQSIMLDPIDVQSTPPGQQSSGQNFRQAARGGHHLLHC